ncbi:hypothetical protein Tco_0225586, partial [Tanacetum coccineum]
LASAAMCKNGGVTQMLQETQKTLQSGKVQVTDAAVESRGTCITLQETQKTLQSGKVQVTDRAV